MLHLRSEPARTARLRAGLGQGERVRPRGPRPGPSPTSGEEHPKLQKNMFWATWPGCSFCFA